MSSTAPAPRSTRARPKPATQATRTGSSPTEEPPSGFNRDDYSRSRSSVGTARPVRLTGVAGDAASVLLGFIVWGWLIRPYLAGGTPGIKNVLRAKFLNQGPKGEQLP